MPQGRIRYHVLAQTALDPSLTNPVNQQFIREHIASLGTYSPNPGDGITKWFPEALAYVDAYSIYITDPLATQHPEWILKSTGGKPLYIPWGARSASGQLPQYAGDFSNPGFCGYQIDRMRSLLVVGYRGIWIDDVNIPVRCTDGAVDTGNNLISTLPANWSSALWAQNMGSFMRLIRAALPETCVLVHNAIWTAGINKAQASACDLFYLERGVSDLGLTGGGGQYSLQSFFSFIDQMHALDTPVIFGDYDVATIEYSVAGWLLVSEDGDMLGFANQPLAAPWPALLALDLGAAKGKRQRAISGLWSRQFDRGAVYLNEPGAPIASFLLPQPAYAVGGGEVTSLSLGPGQGRVVLAEA